MKLRPEDIQIDLEHPFEKDLLNRKEQVNVLSNVVQNIEGGFTLSINAPWGYGKTTFIKMWEASLRNAGYKTVYFNAWESDFISEPMMALIDGLRNTTFDQDFTFEQRKQLSATVDTIIGMTQAIPVVKIIGNVGKAVKVGVDQCLEDTNDFQKTQSLQSLVAEFKEKLTNFAKGVSEDKPLIIFVDELDRCRPDYAVQMLERIKHFFEVKNIIFILAIDKEVICKSIKAFYGGLNIDTTSYLRRFIDLEYDLPEPSVRDFIEAQFEQKGLAKYFSNYEDHIERHYGGADRETTLRVALSDCLQAKSKSLRDIEKYFNRLGVILSSKELPHKYCDITSYLLYLYMFNRDIYEHLRLVDLDIKDLWSMMEEQIESTIIDKRSEPYRRYMGMALSAFGAYIDLVDRKDGYRHEILKDETKLEWFPKDYLDWLKHEINDNKGDVLLRLCSHIELLKTAFNWDTVKGVMNT